MAGSNPLRMQKPKPTDPAGWESKPHGATLAQAPSFDTGPQQRPDLIPAAPSGRAGMASSLRQGLRDEYFSEYPGYTGQTRQRRPKQNKARSLEEMYKVPEF